MEPLLRNISDTALWTATYRARETERPDALFHDPYAARLAGERGARIAEQMNQGPDTTWAWPIRTYLVDRAIERCVAEGTGLVLNLAAGLDTRPYRMSLPAKLRWVEVDFDEILEYKSAILAGETPRCLPLERHGLDLSNRGARQALFDRLGKGLAITEGLVIYLSEEEVGELAQDLARSGFDYWVLDLASPALLKFMQALAGRHTAQAGAPLRFAPAAGPAFFEPYGWKAVSVESVGETAMKLGRVPEAMLKAPPPPPGPDGPIWSGVCLFRRMPLAK
jgi:methyltransferase (TIGR00027 family)